jgi:hypothetical protein
MRIENAGNYDEVGYSLRMRSDQANEKIVDNI